jgi:transcriptional regulator GlxA family with amidase domain
MLPETRVTHDRNSRRIKEAKLVVSRRLCQFWSMDAVFPIEVCIVATPDTVATPLVGIYDVLNSISDLRAFDKTVPEKPPYRVEIVSLVEGPVMTASGIPIISHRAIPEITRTDMVIIPSIMTDASRWDHGRDPALTEWLRAMHESGATICATCSGVFLLAETGLLEGHEATMHWSHAKAFERAFPEIRLNLKKMLITAGGRSELVMSGASTSWQDLILYVVARQLGYPIAHVLAKFFAMQWHADGQSPYIIFTPHLDHGDTAILKAQLWLETNFHAAHPVEEMVVRSDLPERSFKRRFTKATGLSPIKYVQHLRVERAKRWLERGKLPIDEICWKIGYEDTAFFRRLFKRITGMSPGSYRNAFTLPNFDN